MGFCLSDLKSCPSLEVVINYGLSTQHNQAHTPTTFLPDCLFFRLFQIEDPRAKSNSRDSFFACAKGASSLKSKTQHDDGTSVRSLCDGQGEVEGGRRAVPGGPSRVVDLAAPEADFNVRETPSAMNFLRENSPTLVCSVRTVVHDFRTEYCGGRRQSSCSCSCSS